MNHAPDRTAGQAAGNSSSTPAVALITGAADGIGWATARAMAGQGWRIALLDLRADSVNARVAELGTGHLALACDVSDADSVQAAVGSIGARLGRIDALVNNAGIGDQAQPTLQQNAAAFDRVLAVHLRGAFLMSQAVIPLMLAQPRDARGNRGSIVNLGSIASLGGIPGRNAYSAAKAGMLGLTRALASEWARSGIRVNAVAPGYVATELVLDLAQQGALDTRAIARRTPLGRLADPAEIAAAIAFLASPAASYVTGAILSADGGWSAFGAPESMLTPLGSD